MIVFSGEYARMNQTFHDLGIGLGRSSPSC